MGTLQQLVGQTDIYLLDQIVKGRYAASDKVLDAGCGEGRNLHWFVQAGIDVYGADRNEAAIAQLLQQYALPPGNFRVEGVEALSFTDCSFNHVISSTVLHFAQDTKQFLAMMASRIEGKKILALIPPAQYLLGK